MNRILQSLAALLRTRAGNQTLAMFAGVLFAVTGPVWADVPGRTLPGGAVPNPGTQQQELGNITAPAEWNVFEFVVTCGACHGGTVDQHVGHFGNWAGGNMASAARDPVFRANQIGVNNVVKSITGQDGAGNVCFRCHSPNGWLSGRFDPTMGGKADGSTMIQSILLSTDTEGIMCETCHRAVGGVTNKRADLDLLDKVWNLLAGLFDWEHEGRAMTDQDGHPMMADGLPYGDTSLQFLDGMTYIGKYSGMTDVYFSDLPIGGSYTGQIYAVYPDWWVSEGYPTNPVPAGMPAANSAGQYLAYNADGSLPPIFEVPVTTPVNANTGRMDFNAQAFSIEHPTVGAKGRKKFEGDTANNLLPVLPAGPGGSASPNEYIRTSEFCGSCHDLTVPILSHGMPEQRTYTEWKFSSYAQPTNVIADPLNKRTGTGVERCQDCHMPTLKHEYADDNTGSYNADPILVGGFPYGKDRGAQGGTTVHKLAGANRDLPMMMKALYPEVDLEVIGAPAGRDPRTFPGMLSDRGPMYDRAKQNTEITLRDGVDVKIVQPPVEVSSGTYEMKVRVFNKSGHRIPSGYPDGRRFWLSVQAKDANGNPVYQSGVYDEASAELKTDAASTGLNRALTGTIDATVANAVMVYERVTGTCADGAGAIFPDPSPTRTPTSCTASPALTNNFILFDNRIPPKGLDYNAARLAGVKFYTHDAAMVPTEDVARYSAAQLAGGYDDVTYRFAAPAGQAISASVDVLWQTHTREFMEHLRNQDNSTVRPEGPPNVFDPNYPNNPNYLSNSIAGLPLSSYVALDGSPLNDNWGGVAYAAWLATGKGTPFLVDSDSTAVASAPLTAPTVTVRALNATDPDYMDPVTMAPDAFAAKIEWTPVPDADGYTIWVRYGVSEATADWDRLAVVGKDVTSHTEYVFNPGKTYGFKVVAYNGKGEIASAPVNHTIASGLPAAPTTLVASDSAITGSTGASITLTWNDNADNEAGFEIWRFGPMIVNGVPQVYTGQPPVTILGAQGGIATQTGGPAGGVPTTGANTYVDADAALTPNTCYNYQVRAVNALIEVSTWSNVDQGCTTAAAAVAVNLTATPASGTRVDLTWSSTGNGVVNYRVSRNGAVIATVAKTAAPTYSYADTAAAPGTTYTYTVEALDAANAVLATATTTATTPAVPAAPTNAQAVANGAQVTVSWIDNANNEDGFVVERAAVVNGVVGAWQPIPAVGAFLAPNTLQYVDTTALEAGTSAYRVKAINLVNGDSGYATTNQVTLGLNAPTNLTGVLAVPALEAPAPNGTVQVTLNWVDTSLKETAYKVEGCLGSVTYCNNAANWQVLNNGQLLPANSQQLVVQFATSTSNRTARARVTATMGTLSSQAVTAVANIPARAGTPTNLAVADVGGNNHDTLRVTFRNRVSNPVGYQLARCTGGSAACSGNPASNGNWTVLPFAAGTGNVTFNDSGLTAGTTYYYEVRAYNAGGWSNWSGRQSRQVQ